MAYPYDFGYFKPTGKEQLAMGIGSLLAGAMAASQGESMGDAIIKGLAGSTAGYGNAFKDYQNIMGDAADRDMRKNYYDEVKRQHSENQAFRQKGQDFQMKEQWPLQKQMMEARTGALNTPKRGNLPNDAALWEYANRLQPSARSEFLNRSMPLKTQKADTSKDYDKIFNTQIKELDGLYKARSSIEKGIDPFTGIALDATNVQKAINTIDARIAKRESYLGKHPELSKRWNASGYGNSKENESSEVDKSWKQYLNE